MHHFDSQEILNPLIGRHVTFLYYDQQFDMPNIAFAICYQDTVLIYEKKSHIFQWIEQIMKRKKSILHKLNPQYEHQQTASLCFALLFELLAFEEQKPSWGRRGGEMQQNSDRELQFTVFHYNPVSSSFPLSSVFFNFGDTERKPRQIL